MRHETDEARGLRHEYLARLQGRREDLMAVANRANWQVIVHRTDESPRKPLVRLHAILGGT